MRSHPHVTLSPSTPLCGGCPLNDTIFETLNGRHARETRAPHFAHAPSLVCRWPVWCGRPARKGRSGFVVGSERVRCAGPAQNFGWVSP